jgi:hypothetical protein
VAEKVAEEEATKAAAKKRAEDERIAKLPAAEQQKVSSSLSPTKHKHLLTNLISSFLKRKEKERCEGLRHAAPKNSGCIHASNGCFHCDFLSAASVQTLH